MMEGQPANYGIDPQVLDYLMQKRRPQVVNPNNQLMAGLAKASAAMGTLGGKQADTSAIDQMAQAKDAEAMQQGKMMESQRDRLSKYLMGVQKANMQRQQQLADRDEQRDYDKRIRSENRDYMASKQAQNRADSLADYKQRQEISQKNKAQEAEQKAKPKAYEHQVATLSGEKLKRFDSSAMGMEAVVDMHKALEGGSNTFSLIGDNPYTMALSKFEEALGRMQSGGAITSDEVVKFKKMAPSFTDSTEIQRAKMKKLIAEMSSRIINLGFDPDEVLAKRKTISNQIQQKYSNKETLEPDTAIASPPGQYKAGDTRIIDGVTVIRNENGEWEEK